MRLNPQSCTCFNAVGHAHARHVFPPADAIIVQVETREMDFEPDFLRHIFPRINWGALREAAAAMGEP